MKTKPDAVSLPEQAFDEKGDIKPEFYGYDVVAYPEGHSVWSKLELPEGAADWKVADLEGLLSDEHKLTLTAWNLPCGEVTDSDGESCCVGARVPGAGGRGSAQITFSRTQTPGHDGAAEAACRRVDDEVPVGVEQVQAARSLPDILSQKARRR